MRTPAARAAGPDRHARPDPLRHGKLDGERTALAGTARDVDLSLVNRDEGAADRQSEARPAAIARARLVHAVKPPEEVRKMLGGDADPGIGDPDPDARAVALDRQGHGA